MNNSKKVSDETKQKVLDVIQETGYTPNAFARGLGLNSMSTIGIMCSNSSDPYLAKCIYLVEQGLRASHYDSLLCCTGYNIEDKEKYLNLILSKRVDAIILMGSDFIDSTYENNLYILNAAKKIPIILLNGQLNASNIYSVACEDKDLVYDAAKMLITHQKQNLLFLNRRHSYSSSEKIKGFKEACEHCKSMISTYTINTFDGDLKQTISYLSTLNHFDGVITSDDELAVAVLKYAQVNHINIPSNLEIIGYNNSNISIYCTPEISSLDNKLEESCKKVVFMTTEILKGKKVKTNIRIKGKLVKRETSL